MADNNAKYINPLMDWSFKHLFGRESVKDILMGFLNALFEGKHVIEDVIYLNNECQGESAENRAVIYDVHCRTDKGEYIIVEMQNREQPYFKDRALFYMSRSVVEQAPKGIWDFKLSAVYGVFFLNFTMDSIADKDAKQSLTEVGLVDLSTGAIFNPKFRQFYIELPRFQKTELECVTSYDKWIYILKNMEDMNTMPFIDQDAVFARLEQTASRANLTKEERAAYEREWRNANDYVNTMQFAVDKAEKEKALQIARNLRGLGISQAQIAQVTGLSIEELEV